MVEELQERSIVACIVLATLYDAWGLIAAIRSLPLLEIVCNTESC